MNADLRRIVTAKYFQERGGCGREVCAATMCGPEDAIVSETTNGDTYQDSALQLFTHTHAGIVG